MAAKINWEAFHEGLGLVNQAIGPWRALARLEEVLQYGTVLREQIQLAEARLADAVRNEAEKQKELAEVDHALAELKRNYEMARLHEESEKARIEKVWDDMNRKHQDLHEKEIERGRQIIADYRKKWEEEKKRLEKEEMEKRGIIKDLTQTLSSLRDKVKGLE